MVQQSALRRNHLYRYQEEGASFLSMRRHALLADEMGLGKTVQAIIAAGILGAEKLVVICPAIARSNWRRELEQWNYSGETVIESYDKSIRPSFEHAVRTYVPDLMILDEAHYLKNPKSQRTRTLYGKGCTGNGLIRYAKRVWLLSGTPMPNNASELWPMMHAMFGLRLNWWNYIRRYCRYEITSYGLKISGNRNVEELKEILKPHVLRRRQEQVLDDLPAMTWETVTIDPEDASRKPDETAEALSVRQAINSDREFSSIIQNPVLATLRREVGLAKAAPAAKLVKDELQRMEYQKIFIVAYHRDVIGSLAESLKDFGAVIVTGGTPSGKRQVLIDRFQNDPQCRVFIGQITAAGTAVSLTATNQVLFAETSWSPGDLVQAAKRCHRIGQKRPVFVRILALSDSLDESVSRVLAGKARMISQILN